MIYLQFAARDQHAAQRIDARRQMVERVRASISCSAAWRAILRDQSPLHATLRGPLPPRASTRARFRALLPSRRFENRSLEPLFEIARSPARSPSRPRITAASRTTSDRSSLHSSPRRSA